MDFNSGAILKQAEPIPLMQVGAFLNKRKPSKRKAETFSCKLCDIEVGSEASLQNHMNGQKHAKKIRQIAIMESSKSNEQLQQQQQKDLNVISNNLTNQVVESTSTENGTQQKIIESNVLQKLNELTKYHKLQIIFETLGQSGPPHARLFEVKCKLIDQSSKLETDTTNATSTSIHKAKQLCAQILLERSNLSKPPEDNVKNENDRSTTKRRPIKINDQEKSNSERPNYDPEAHFFRSKAEQRCKRYESNTRLFNRRYLLAKHLQIQPDAEQTEIVESLVSSVETNLKSISDKLMNEEINKVAIAESEIKDKEEYRQLKGVVRVGAIVKTIFLKTDRHIDLVMLTLKLPKFDLLKRVSDELQNELSSVALKPNVEAAIDFKLYYSVDMNEVCLNIKCELSGLITDCYTIKLSFTSMCLLSNPEEKIDSNLKEKCKKSLNEITRLKWFNVNLKPIANAILLMRVLRDLCRRSPTWSKLSDWSLELLVGKCFWRNKYECVTEKFRTFFELVSGGAFMLPELSITTQPTLELTEVFGMNDPCADASDSTQFVFNYLSKQEKEDLTASAQQALRLISFQKIVQLLEIDLVSSAFKI